MKDLITIIKVLERNELTPQEQITLRELKMKLWNLQVERCLKYDFKRTKSF